MKIIHPLEPIYDENSKVLILGTIPSVKSRENNFYYAHPKNRFWKILAKIYDEDIPQSNEGRKDFLLRHHIALFDVLKSCDILSSSDNSIKNPVPNDLNDILYNSKIKVIFVTGKMAYKLYMKLIYPNTNLEPICLPSTSPANCPKGIEERLYKEYSQIREITNRNCDTNNLEKNLKVFIKILHLVKNTDEPIILSGSTSLALQGVDINVHDIDIVTSKQGAIIINNALRDYNVIEMKYSITDKYQSYFGTYIIDDVKVEVMGEFQYKLKNGDWSKENHLHKIHYISYSGEKIPVLSLEQELVEYENTNKIVTINKIKERLSK